jgi:5'-3' exonuclease
MGIRGLAGYLKWKSPNSRKNIQWNKHIGERWAIDCSCLLYRARAVGLNPITVVASLIVRLRMAQIEPIVIFDGKPPMIKSDTLEQRRVVRATALQEIEEIQERLKDTGLSELDRVEQEVRVSELQAKAPRVSAKDRDDIKKFLYSAGVLFITANGEADDILSYLSRHVNIHAVISTDMDMLARGVPLLVVPETNDATVLTGIFLNAALTDLRLTFKQFVRACVLMGTDYMDREWKTFEPRFAVEAVKRGTSWDTLDISGEICSQLDRAVGLLQGDGVAWTDLLSDTQQAKWTAGAPTKEPENLVAFCVAHGWPTDWVYILLK